MCVCVCVCVCVYIYVVCVWVGVCAQGTVKGLKRATKFGDARSIRAAIDQAKVMAGFDPPELQEAEKHLQHLLAKDALEQAMETKDLAKLQAAIDQASEVTDFQYPDSLQETKVRTLSHLFLSLAPLFPFADSFKDPFIHSLFVSTPLSLPLPPLPMCVHVCVSGTGSEAGRSAHRSEHCPGEASNRWA